MKQFKVGELIVRRATLADLPAYIKIQKIEWKDLAVAEEQAKSRFHHNLEGILIAQYKEEVVGSVTTMRIENYDTDRPKSWYQVTNHGLCTAHKPKGRVCFGVDLSVATDRAPSGTVDALFVGCMDLVISLGVKYFMLGGRMPKYHLYADKMEPEKYLYKKTARGHYLDPQVNLYSRVPFMKIVGLAPDYFKDPDSLNYGVILRWRNPFYRLPFKVVWADFAGLLFEKYLTRQRRAHKKKL
ncbi:hypothetical protein KW794_01655, partial [Candidatus Saccharibacteria bacterium]|nr:hypothetical protein [Candidatus Saccharibacteria bacterium]